MEIPRGKGAARTRLIKRIVMGIVLLSSIGAISLGVHRMQPAAQSVERSTVWPDTVKRGEMIRQVRGLGTLETEDILTIPATNVGRDVPQPLLADTIILPDKIILELTNPELQAAMSDVVRQ